MHDNASYHAFIVQEIRVVGKKIVSYDAGRRDERVNEQLLTPAQVGERLQVTERTVYQWLRDRRLVGLKLGRLWRVRSEDLEAFLERSRTADDEG
jgi:excisionase family DNA binding protein